MSSRLSRMSWCHLSSSWARVLGFTDLYVWKASWEDWTMGSTSSAARSEHVVNTFPVPGSVFVSCYFALCYYDLGLPSTSKCAFERASIHFPCE